MKTINEYTKWGKSPHFLELTNLVLQTKFANDTEDVYAVCVENAKTGDVQCIKLMLELQKQIKQFNKESQKLQKTNDSNPFDNLELDRKTIETSIFMVDNIKKAIADSTF